ncbi:MAG: hypothetical protein HY700_16930 [Gemmatimonadetes bacterium]|nr:hypothetical protein [Gemmatimonadota bacterium]
MDNQTILKIADILVPALAGLAGVLVGAWMTSRGQKQERRHAWLRRQLDEFYSPMLGMRGLILAKSVTRVKVGEAAGTAWHRLISGRDPEQQMAIEKEHVPGLEKIIQYENQQHKEEILPLYRKMVEHFTTHLGLAEQATRLHFDALVHFVEVWNRWEKEALPPEVSRELGSTEEALHPFYQDLAVNLERLQSELKK